MAKCARLSCPDDATVTVTVRFHSGRVKRECLCADHGEIVQEAGLHGEMAPFVARVDRSPIRRAYSRLRSQLVASLLAGAAQNRGNRAIELSPCAGSVTS